MTRLRPEGPNPVIVALIRICALLLALSVAFLTDTTSTPGSAAGVSVRPEGLASLGPAVESAEPGHSSRESSASRGTARTTPPTPRAGVVRATHSPAPAEEGEAEAGAGAPSWPRYRDLDAEPAWVQAAAECVIDHESRYAGMYQAVNPAGPWYGAYQFAQSTWTSVTGLTGAPTAYGPEVQDDAFATLWNRGAGAGHWAGSDC